MLDVAIVGQTCFTIKQQRSHTMEILGKRGESYQIDEELRDTARVLVEEYSEVVGHVDLQRVVFVRLIGKKLSKTGRNWLGKCMNVKPPTTILPRYVVMKLASMGLMDINQISGIEEEILDLDYIIMINDEAVQSVNDAVDVEKLTILHELMHIPQDMEGVTKHDVEDFYYLVDKFGSHWTNGIISQEGEGEVPGQLKSFEQRLRDSGVRMSDGGEDAKTEDSD